MRGGSWSGEPGVPKPPTIPAPFHLSTADTVAANAAAHRERHGGDGAAREGEGEGASPAGRRASGGAMHPAAQRELLRQALESDGVSFLTAAAAAAVAVPHAAAAGPAPSSAGRAGGSGIRPPQGRRTSPRAPAATNDVTLGGPGIDITHMAGR